MTEGDLNYEYDIAFSFHSKDEGLATQLNDLLQDRFKTFLYSEQQKVLAGSDGELIFSAVFAKKARVVVIFYRQEWGETPFTRIEQTAIRGRAYDEGFDFTLFIPTGDAPSVPPWLPKTRLYYGLTRFGMNGAAGVVEARIQELGGEPRVESIIDRAARLGRALAFNKKAKEFNESKDGVDAANAAYIVVCNAIEEFLSKINLYAAEPFHLRRHQDSILVLSPGAVLHFSWSCRYSNSLQDGVFKARFYSGVPRLPGLAVFEDPQTLGSSVFAYELLGPDRSGYVDNTDRARQFSPTELAAELLRKLMDFTEKRR